MVLPLFSRYRYLLWITVLVLVASGTILLAACGETGTNGGASTPTPTTQQQGSTPTSSGGNTFQVSMVDNNGTYAFDPTTLTVPKGAMVIWTNKSGALHTVTSDTNAFTASDNLSESQTFKMTFTTAGTYAYHCSIHPYMKATITVTG